jgi:PAS domain-containing protein
MSDSVPRPRKPSASQAGKLPVSGEGSWELDLLSGNAWFSDWFFQRLQWPAEVKRRRLVDLRPNLPGGAWEALLLAIRAHLERQVPLDKQICVHLPGGEIQWWRVLGTSLRNGREKPVLLTGSMQDVSAERRANDPDRAT